MKKLAAIEETQLLKQSIMKNFAKRMALCQKKSKAFIFNTLCFIQLRSLNELLNNLNDYYFRIQNKIHFRFSTDSKAGIRNRRIDRLSFRVFFAERIANSTERIESYGRVVR